MGAELGRRGFLKGAVSGMIGAASGLPALAMSTGEWVEESAQAVSDAGAAPKYHIKFAVIGISHDHIYGMVGAVMRGGGELVAVMGAEPEKMAAFTKRFSQAKVVKTEEEILDDPSIQLVMTSTIPVDRAPLGVRAMRKGKDFLSDKPGATTLEQLAEVRKAVMETNRIYAILYSERLEVKAAVYAGELVQKGAIGKVVQTINIAPHQIVQGHGDAGGGSGRPWWFWDDSKFGGILCDIGSHQVDQFLFYTGSTSAEVVASQVANVKHKQYPRFQDFGDMMLRGDKGFGYVRLDWFTPAGLGTWGDGRLFILGTEGYMELRKYVDITGRKGGNHLFFVDGKEQRYIDCSNVDLPFGPQLVADVVNRTHTAQDQAQCLLAAELVIRAQNDAKHVDLKA